MTLLHLRGQIVSWLCEHDTISAADFGTFKVTEDLKDRRDLLVMAALANLVEIGMLQPAGADLWILTQPLNAQGQEVHLSMPLCNEIADVINTDLEAKDIEDRVDPLNIHEGHIMALLSIINELLVNDPDET